MIINYAEIAQNRRLIAVAALAKHGEQTQTTADVIAFPGRMSRQTLAARRANRTQSSQAQLPLAA